MAEKFVDTREQSLAQSYDRHLSVNANAGSGKTTVLQKRFVSLLLDDNLKVEPRELVAITFTRKAAAEIFAKIAKAIEEIIQNPLISKSQHAKLIRIRERLNSAHISTIHSFCSSIIRDFPVESGVPPNFAELTEAEKIKITNEAITEVLTNYLTANDDNTLKLKVLISAFGKKKVVALIKSILYKREFLPKINKFYEVNSDDEINLLATKEFIKFLKVNYSEDLKNVSDVFEVLIDLSLSSEKNIVVITFLAYLNSINKLISLDNVSLSDINEFHSQKISRIIDGLMEQKVLTVKYLLNSVTFKKILGDDLQVLNSKLHRFEELCTILSCLDNSEYQLELISYSRFLIKLANEVNEIIDFKKQEIGGLDFDDLLIITQEMLQDTVVCEKIRKRFRFLMVDEFQDTNEIQYNIIKSLVPQLTDSSLSNPINLFIVGDPKQSIYGFRNADVRVFKRATEDIKKSNQSLIQDNNLSEDIQTTKGKFTVDAKIQTLGELGLTVSFRHLPVITAFTNLVCESTMSRKESDFDVEYANLVCSKRIQELNEFTDSSGIEEVLESQFGSVKILVCEKVDKENNDERISESEMLVRYINNLIANSDYKYSDIAILSRARTKFSELSNTFQKYEIPYVLHSGKGFYQQQEVIDIISILKFLHNPGDDLALTAALRSPYFGFTDTQILQISTSKQKSLFEVLEQQIKNNDNIDNAIVRTYEILSKLLLYSTRLSISNLIAQTIELCGWYGTSAASSARSQVTANLLKLKQFASDFESKGFKTLFDFVEEVNIISKEEITESEAVYITDENAVNIMTIHAAKGLEFPVVALFNTNTGIRTGDSFVIDEELGFAFHSPIYNHELNGYEQVVTPLFSLAQNKNILKDKAELKRLLYVALTRAKEHLIITADLNSKNHKNSLFELILQGLKIEQGLLQPGEMNYSCDLQTYFEERIVTKNVNFKVDFINEVEYINQNKSVETLDIPASEILMGDIKSEISNDMFSASRIIKFRNDKEAYFNRYVLGFDDELSSQQHLVNNSLSESESLRVKNEKHNISGAEEGTVIHYIMENISGWYVDGNIEIEKLESTIEDASFSIRKELSKEFKVEIIKEINNVVSTGLIKNNINEILNSKHEAEYNIPILFDFLNAKIDLLFGKNSVYEVWDWKSNMASSKDVIPELAEHYKFQMKVYAYLIMLLQPDLKKFKARLLFTKLARPEAKNEDWTYELCWTKEELQSFKTELENNIRQIKSA